MNKFCGLIGRKLGHSYSEPIHNLLGMEKYVLTELEPEELDRFFSETDIGLLNVTIPYKKDVLKYCSALSDEARAVGSVNTVIGLEDGTLYGHNTDVHGFLYAADSAGIDLTDKKLVIFGNGGASLAVQYAARVRKARETVVISRTGENNYENLFLHYDADVLINATPVGMYPKDEESLVDVSAFKNCIGVIDLIFNPLRTNLIIQAEELGIANTGGLSMLVAQAVAAEELYLGKKFALETTENVLGKIVEQKENIILIGMPGSGKSTVGERIAEKTGRRLFDTDAEIVKTAQKSIPDIFAEGGEALFREYEAAEILKAGKESGAVIVTGGGAVTRKENYASLHRNGRIFHLVRDLSLLSREGRPLSMTADLKDMYEKRKPLYESFRDEVVENGSDIDSAAEKIISLFKNRK